MSFDAAKMMINASITDRILIPRREVEKAIDWCVDGSPFADVFYGAQFDEPFGHTPVDRIAEAQWP